MAQGYYNPDELAKIHEMELGILKDFIGVCEKHNLTYFGMAGPGLGAVRHQGFIPWDDDIDIAIPRKDFDILIKVFEEEYSDKYHILNTQHNPDYPLPTTRICINGTKFVERFFTEINCDFGIFLDVFPFDNLADNRWRRFWQLWIAWFWGKLIILRSIKNPYLSFGGFGGKIIRFICAMVHYVLRGLHISKKWLHRRCMHTLKKFNDKETRLIGFPCDTSPHYNTISRDKVFPLIEMEFEGMMLKFPNDTHYMLEMTYGPDYMQLPPVEKRKTHFPAYLDFGDGHTINGD